MRIPSDYLDGCDRARRIDPGLADDYLAHTHTGDPVADKAVEQFAALDRSDALTLLMAAIDDPNGAVPDDMPPAAFDLLDAIHVKPDWLDHEAFKPGIRLFHRDPSTVLGAMVAGALVEGFSTNISKSFFITGRLRDQGVRRLRQNNRHMLEIFLPGGLQEYGDGWKLSVRIRIIHAQSRYLLSQSEDWDTQAWGIPLHAAHLGFAITAFSERMLKHMESLGIRHTSEEADSFMAIWRYTGYLMGIPETILYRDREEACRMYEIGTACEPDGTLESVAMANSLIESAPLIAGIDDPAERRKLARYIFRVSRALIGDSLADRFNYPQSRSTATLAWYRFSRCYHQLLQKYLPLLSHESNFTAFNSLLTVSELDELAISYRLPTHAYSEESSEW